MAVFNGPGSFGRGGSGIPGGFGQGNPFSGNPGGRRRIELSAVADEETQKIVAQAFAEAQRHGESVVGSLRILHAAAQHERVAALLQAVGLGPAAFRPTELRPGAEQSGSASPDAPSLGFEGSRVLSESLEAARATGAQRIAPEHLLLALAMTPDLPAGRQLGEAGATPDRLIAAAQGHGAAQAGANPDDGADSMLAQYGDDLTARARDGGFDPVIGRGDEIEQVVEILLRRTKNNPVLIGEAGVGKTAIVEGLAQRIADGDVPELLLGRRVVALDLAGMLSGTRYRGDFEERLTKLLDEISAAEGETLVFVDELHTIVGAGGSEGAMDAGNILKPKLARGDLHMIGATTLDEYRKNIEKDPALERRFQPVSVAEPSVEDAVLILAGLRPAYEKHHGVAYTEEAIRAAVELSKRYMTDRLLPDKAIDLIDQAGARKRLASVDTEALHREIARLTAQKDDAVAAEDYETAGTLRDKVASLEQRIDAAQAEESADAGDAESDPGAADRTVTAEDIAVIIARATGIPADRMTEHERDRLVRLEDELHARVIGQDDAVHAIARAVRRSRAGMSDPNRPVGSFLFLGPTGVGKTELAKTLAQSLFGDADRMIRLDMSEFGERHTASRLVGSPPGYVGYGEAGQLTEKVRRNPYSVVLLDEIEKAHPDVFNVLLQVLDDGRLTDGQGRTVDFTNTVLIMTSNLGSEFISSRSGGLGFGTLDGDDTEKQARDRVMGRLRESFRPEFLNRIDEVVVFQKLAAEQLHRITDKLLEDSRERLAAREIGIRFSDEVVGWLAERGHQPEYGARPLRRTIQREIDDRVADLLLDDGVHSGDTIEVTVDGDELALTAG
ncbi:ATP-dependent Clp protease ATP-binding subunit [Tomitella gaofuii]|uniref:ATP-dependent Clp protease ATP-binding subunit n=1 Tax=Tomitella gaofuii TaxID=2760083 RepID=UPI0015FC16AB|nr:ATP-dependent Clp protease ATP-binding subunit [Tomitella gaofuii]